MIRSLCELYAVSGDASALQEAKRSAQWVSAHRSLAGGGFSHGDHDAAGPFLGDSLAMGQAFLALYEATGEREWLRRAAAARRFIAANFGPAGSPGFVTSKIATDNAYAPHPERDENAQLARFSNLLSYYTGIKGDRETATSAMRYLATSEIALQWLSAPILLAEQEYTRPPLHVTIVGSKHDPQARLLFAAATNPGTSYMRIEWWDMTEGPLPFADVQYPSLSHAAAFLCTATTCSSPITDPKVLEARVRKAGS
jgi:uncharacterized protein YyaL (SSP411 family)